MSREADCHEPFAPAAGDALLIVDVQRDLLPGGALAVPEGDAIVEVLNRYVAQFERLGLPVVVARKWHPVNHISFREFGGSWPAHCVAGTAGAELAPSLHVPPHAPVLSKGAQPEADRDSAFEGTRLAQLLRRKGCRRVLIGGLATDECLLATACDALREGFHPVILEDAVRAAANPRRDDCAHALARLVRRGAHLVHLAA